MNLCEQALLRLKEQLVVATDKEVAELLGMGEKALNARKKRDAFPEDKLFAFVAKNPERNIDVAYVMTGTPAVVHGVMAEIKAAADIASRLGGGGDRLAATHAAIRGAHLTPDDVHQAVLDAVDLLSLEKKVDAQQLAKAVVKLCLKSSPGTATAAVPIAQTTIAGQQANNVMVGNVVSGQGNHIAGGDMIVNPGKAKQ